MKITLFIALFATVCITSCKKLDEYEGNNKPFSKTTFEIEEVITLAVPNSAFSFGGFLNCTSLLGLNQDYQAFIPTNNPNPYADLVYDMHPKQIIMELVNIPDCDFGMLKNVEVFLADNGISNQADFILQDPADLDTPFNAAKIGEFQNIPEESSTYISIFSL